MTYRCVGPVGPDFREVRVKLFKEKFRRTFAVWFLLYVETDFTYWQWYDIDFLVKIQMTDNPSFDKSFSIWYL